MRIPEGQNTITALIDAAHEAKRASHKECFRPHMGASTLGEKCERKLWLSFRWAVREKFDGRILRVFRRGHREEETVVEDLRAIGMKVRATGADQTRVEFGSHVSGSIDGIITAGVPEAPKAAHVLEIKTHSKKSWEDVEKQGVEKSQPKHFTQMQIYMRGTGVDRALYVAICKDDDRIYTERVRYDREHAERAIERGQRIALADEMPPPISTDPTWYECKWCSAHDLCHGSRVVREVNCRTCAHSTATEESTWTCARHGENVMPTDWMREAHDCHALHFDLVPWLMAYMDNSGAPVFIIDGAEVVNGPGGFSSSEIVANPQACVDPTIVQLRRKFGGRILA
jgi:CRISPR/Cas system-associated exonuclease Cas4 (RecB family)